VVPRLTFIVGIKLNDEPCLPRSAGGLFCRANGLGRA